MNLTQAFKLLKNIYNGLDSTNSFPLPSRSFPNRLGVYGRNQRVQLHNYKAVFIYSNINPRLLNHEKIYTQITRKKFNSTL